MPKKPTRRAVLTGGAAASVAVLPTESATAIPISALGMQIREAVAEYVAAGRAIDDGPDDPLPAAQALFDAASERLDDLEKQLPSPPCTLADIISRAEIAFCVGDKDADGRLIAFSSDWANPDEVAAARVIEAVLQFAGVRHD